MVVTQIINSLGFAVGLRDYALAYKLDLRRKQKLILKAACNLLGQVLQHSEVIGV